MRSAVKNGTQDREPLAQGKLENTQASKSSSLQTSKQGSSVASSQSSFASGSSKAGSHPAGKPPAVPASNGKDNKGARMVLEVQKQPSAKEIRESINVPEIMNSGGDIS